jgi:hypothetical protein
VFLSDVLPTAWQGVEYADVPDGGSLVVLGLGPIGDMATRIAQYRGHRVIGVDLDDHDDLAGTIRVLTDGRGPDAVGWRRTALPPLVSHTSSLGCCSTSRSRCDRARPTSRPGSIKFCRC